MLQTRHEDLVGRDGPDSDKRFYGVYLGFIRDSNDPEQRGRVRVHCPEVMGEVDSTDTWLDWAEAEGFMAGFDQGFFAVPPDPSWSARDSGGRSSPLNVNLVWVHFRAGDPARPIYSARGPWFGENELPSHTPKLLSTDRGGDETTTSPNFITSASRFTVASPGDNSGADPGTLLEQPVIREPRPATEALYPYNHIYKSPAGHVIEIDNTPQAERFRLYHPAGTLLEINAAGTWSTKVQGLETRFVVGEATHVFKSARNCITEGTAFEQFGRSSTAVFRDSRVEVVERRFDSYLKSGWHRRVGGAEQVECGLFNVQAVGGLTMLSGGILGLTGDEVSIGGQNVEITSADTVVRGIGGVRLATASATLATHPIYASTTINNTWSAAAATAQGLVAALNSAVSLSTGGGLPPTPIETAIVTAVTGLSALIQNLSASFNTNITVHRVSRV